MLPACWLRLTHKERLLFVLTCAFIIAIIAESVVLIEIWKHQNAPEEHNTDLNDICSTKSCVVASAEILNSINRSVDPCDNFYEFSCGGFVRQHYIPEDKAEVSLFSKVQDILNKQLKELLQEPIQKNEPLFYTKAKTFYQSCMDISQMEKLGTQPLKDLLRALGGWPVVEGDSWNSSEFDWQHLPKKSRAYGLTGDEFLDLSVGTNLKNSSQRILEIAGASLGLDLEYLTEGLANKHVKAYLKYKVKLAEYLGADPETARTDMKEVVLFQSQLANITPSKQALRDSNKLYNPFTVKELQEKFPFVSWLDYINSILAGTITIDENEVINIELQMYIPELQHLLARTDKRTQANFALGSIVEGLVYATTEEARAIERDYEQREKGTTVPSPRWQDCVGIIPSCMSTGVGAVYIRRYFQEDSKIEAIDMVHRIRQAFINILANIPWMDSVTKHRAREKAAAMITHIGYASELLDDAKVNKLYQELHINSSTFFDNLLRFTNYTVRNTFSKLREKINKTDWVNHGVPIYVNAYYSTVENCIEIPAGILQGPFFSSNRPRYLNYGAIGSIIGHEITHGFDDEGSQYDKDGNLKNWWKEETFRKYINNTNCIIWQYGNYTVREVNMTINGINTQGENIADNGGVREAYEAYQQWVKENGPEKLLPGLPYNQNQLFWIGMANVWCTKERPQALEKQIITGVHAPEKFRLIGSLSNMPEFARDFKCPQNSPMNPSHRCRVW